MAQLKKRHRLRFNQNSSSSIYRVRVTGFQGSANFLAAVRGCLLLQLLILAPVPVLAQSNQPSDFVSIDCGDERQTYPDNNTELEWEYDDNYLDSARDLYHEGTAIRVSDLENDNAEDRDNAEQLKTAMAFLPGITHSRTKFCYIYENKLQPGATFLVRAMFPSKNLRPVNNHTDDRLQFYSARFYFTLDSSFITTVDLHGSKTKTIELVVDSLDKKIYICLVPLEDGSSVAAISSLEVRPFNGGLYNRQGTGLGDSEGQTGSVTTVQSSYLILIDRLNFGGDLSKSVRYPYDKYDRIWRSPKIPDADKSLIERAQSKRDRPAPDSNLNFFDVPARVVDTAWKGTSLTAYIPFTFNISEARASRSMSRFTITLFLSDVDQDDGNATSTRLVDIKLGLGSVASQIVVDDWAENARYPSTWYSFKQRYTEDLAHFRVEPLSNPNASVDLPAMISSVELYGEFEVTNGRTYGLDVEAIEKFSNSSFNISALDTAGDPCLPVPWSWLVCSIEVPPRITQINVTRKGVQTQLSADFGQLNLLTILDLSNNKFEGDLPDSIKELTTLRVLNLANNKLSGELPDFPNNSLANLESLSLAENEFTGSLASLINALGVPMSTLDLSSNKFSGSIPNETGKLLSLRELDFSSNQLTGKVNFEIGELGRLKKLKLDHNGLTGTVPVSIWAPDSKLEEVHLNNNEFEVLNLTAWFQSTQHVQKDKEGRLVYVGKQKVQLRYNKIREVILPDNSGDGGEFFQLTASQQLSQGEPNYFILLGNNPWCSDRQGANETLVTRYLCRAHEYQDWSRPDNPHGSGSKKTVIIISIVAGLILLLMAAVVVAFLWNMWRRTRELRQIQEALAKDNVRPPWFKYETLKTATCDFSTETELGTGAFGSVYKAVLPDGTILAVKRLFPTEQNVEDFFKEMVLISGIKHRNLIQLKGCCVRGRQRMLVYEFAENNDLAKALWGKKRTFLLDWSQRFNACLGIARGLSYLHEELQPKIIHRDIKCQNILLDKDYSAKIADFGLARPVAETDATQMATSIGGTLGYFSPEYATLGILSEKLDVYSYGVIVLEVVAGRQCIDLNMPPEQAYLRNWALQLQKEDKLLNLLQEDLQGTCPPNQVLLVVHTALQCIHEDPKNRPSMSQVVSMLMGGTEVASEIVKELQKTSLSRTMPIDPTEIYNTLFEDAIRNQSTAYGDERDDRYLLSSSSTNSSTSKLIQLSAMRPR